MTGIKGTSIGDVVLPMETISIDQFEGPFEHILVGPVNKSMGHGSIDDGCFETLNLLQPESTIEIKVPDHSKPVLHAYSRVGVIKPGTYTRALLRGHPKPRGVRLKTPGCVSLCSIAAQPGKPLRPSSAGPSKAHYEDNHKEDGETAIKRCRLY